MKGSKIVGVIAVIALFVIMAVAKVDKVNSNKKKIQSQQLYQEQRFRELEKRGNEKLAKEKLDNFLEQNKGKYKFDYVDESDRESNSYISVYKGGVVVVYYNPKTDKTERSYLHYEAIDDNALYVFGARGSADVRAYISKDGIISEPKTFEIGGIISFDDCRLYFSSSDYKNRNSKDDIEYAQMHRE